MARLLFLGASDLRAALPMPDAVAAMKQAFAAVSAGQTSMPLRGVIDAGAGTTLVMGAALPGVGLASKTVSVFPGNAARGRPVVSGLVTVLDPDTGEPVAVCDGTFLTAWRTGAASGAATDLLARPDARRAAVFGSGAQARTQLLAIAATRPLERARVWSLDAPGLDRFLAEMPAELAAEGGAVPALEAAESAAHALDGAEIVCTATTASRPVFDGALLEPGCHLNAVGAYTLDTREIDAVAVGRSRVVVDQLEAACEEAGDLVLAEQEGATARAAWTELGAVVRDPALGRRDPGEITFFKSVGLAAQDVAAAARAVAGARERGLGQTLELT